MSFKKQMKAIAFLVVLFTAVTVNAQNFILSGKVTDDNGAIPGVSILVKNSKNGVETDFDGKYQLQLPKGKYTIVYNYMGPTTIEKKINLDKNLILDIKIGEKSELLDEVLVSAVRVKADAPVTHSNLSKKEIEKRNLGQDIPMLLNYLPSVVTTSDAGAGVGYTGIRVRGSDATRVNITINGIPYNDSESQGTYWVNMPDFASSTQSIQLQRGVGTSTNGAGAFGASLNVLTDADSDECFWRNCNFYRFF